MSDTKAGKGHYHRIRQELAVRLGFGDDPDALPIDRSMRLDVVVGLKLALDEQRARQYRGESIDTAEMLRLSEALEDYLPKQPEPEPDDGDDPHANLMRIVEGWIEAEAQERAEKAAERRAQGLSEPVTDLASAQARIDELEAENARLRGEEPKLLAAPSGIPESEREVITPTESEIIPPGEIGDLNMVPPRRSPPTIDVKANSTAPTAAEREAKRQAINNDRSIEYRIMTAPSLLKGEPKPSLGNEPWRGHTKIFE